jgi:hypothetical protein
VGGKETEGATNKATPSMGTKGAPKENPSEYPRPT